MENLKLALLADNGKAEFHEEGQIASMMWVKEAFPDC